jgi:hypothetical protein
MRKSTCAICVLPSLCPASRQPPIEMQSGGQFHALNSRHFLKTVVTKILKCRNVRGNKSEREGAGSALSAGQNESSRTPQVLARIFTKEDRSQHDTTGMIGASSQHLSQGELGGPQSDGEQVSCLQREIKRGLVTYLSVPRTSFTMSLSSLRR